MNYQTVKKNYDRGLWNKTLVKKAVKKGILTHEEYREITGEDYE
jgi:hypothetical protein